jgi:hypothetical protein
MEQFAFDLRLGNPAFESRHPRQVQERSNTECPRVYICLSGSGADKLSEQRIGGTALA